MAQRNPYRTLARVLEGSIQASVGRSKKVALYLTREEWGLVVEALRQMKVETVPVEKGDLQ